MLTDSQHIYWHTHAVTRQTRELLNQHQALVLWFTGLSGSGKSTIAGALEQALHLMNIRTYLLDGDNIRHGLCNDLDFSTAGRQENIRRVGEVAKLMMDAGLVVLTAFISPYRHERANVRQKIPSGNFVEVYVDTPLAICEQRDPKGLYRLAREGKIQDFTGINSQYEAPLAPEIILEGDKKIEELVIQLVDYLQYRLSYK